MKKEKIHGLHGDHRKKYIRVACHRTTNTKRYKH